MAKAGRPRNAEKVNKSKILFARVDQDTMSKINTLSDEIGINKSDFIRDAVKIYSNYCDRRIAQLKAEGKM